MKTYKIACIPGDGIGKEVSPAGQEVLQALAGGGAGFGFQFTSFGWGGDWYRAHGTMMPDDGLEQIRGMDAILFGSAGDPHIPDHITPVGPAPEDLPGLRPVRQRAAHAHPARHRRAPEALRARGPGLGDRARELRRRVRRRRRPRPPGPPDRRSATDVSMMTRAGVERIMRFAFRLAQSRPRKLLTVVTKSNAQRHGMVMWDEIASPSARSSRTSGGTRNWSTPAPPAW
jgi:tartrate dehydrogenase/decarboxylase/D-malate dehydrogenase